MSVSKLTINGAIQMDLTQDTVDAENLMTGYTAHAADGSAVTGTHVDGGGAAGESGALFIDYDGTELYSYTTAQALALNALPANPTHTGLTAQGWNWTLAEIKSYLTKYPDGLVIVGQMYITDDGKTRIYIHLEEGRKSPILGICPNGTVDVDWGDGTAHDTLTGTSVSEVQWTQIHNYASGGDYIIKLTVVNGTMGIYGEHAGNSDWAGTYLLRVSSSTDKKNYYYRDDISKIEIGSGVTNIGNSAFEDCYSIQSITIPNSITTINQYAFFQCYSIKSIIIPDSVININTLAFSECNLLKSVSLGDGVTSIGEQAFNACKSLIYVTIPDNEASIGTSAFKGCYSIINIVIPENTITAKYVLRECRSLKCLTIGSGVTMDAYLCYYCSSLTNIIIQEGLTGISASAFYFCSSLKSIIIPNSVTTIGNYAFSDSGLENIIIPDTVTSIGTYVFNNCYSLKSAIIGEGITNLNDYLFNNCYSLQNVILPDDLDRIGQYSFYHCESLKNISIPDSITSINTSAFQYCYALMSINIPNSLTDIGSYAFQYCYALKEIALSNNMSSVNSSVFAGCKSVKYLTIPAGIGYIDSNAFSGCASLTNITIPGSVYRINSWAFSGCYSVKEYHIIREYPPTLAYVNAFDSISSDCIIYVPYSADHSILAAYQAATNWSTYASQIQEEPQ